MLRQQGHPAGGQAPTTITSTAHAKCAIRGLDFVIALILCTSRESKRTLRSINDDAGSALVWVVELFADDFQLGDRSHRIFSGRRRDEFFGLLGRFGLLALIFKRVYARQARERDPHFFTY